MLGDDISNLLKLVPVHASRAFPRRISEFTSTATTPSYASLKSRSMTGSLVPFDNRSFTLIVSFLDQIWSLKLTAHMASSLWAVKFVPTARTSIV